MAQTARDRTGRTEAFAATVIVIAGVFSSAQARMTGELGHRMGDVVLPAVWSFGSGVTFMGVMALRLPAIRGGLHRIAAALRGGSLRWYHFAGGATAAFFITSMAYAVPKVGVSLVTVAVVAGQTGNALIVDRFGIGTPAVPLRLGRVLAAIVTLGGVAVASLGDGGNATFAVVPVIVAILAGGLGSLQAGLTGIINRESRQPAATALSNNSIAFLLLVFVLAGLAMSGRFDPTVPIRAPWWAWFGGVIGVLILMLMVWAVHRLGVLVLMLSLLSGQLLGAVGLDIIAPTDTVRIGPAVLAGVLITLLGAFLGAALTQRARMVQNG